MRRYFYALLFLFFSCASSRNTTTDTWTDATIVAEQRAVIEAQRETLRDLRESINGVRQSLESARVTGILPFFLQ
jgi:hypothetical protein